MAIKTIEKTGKLKLIPLTKRDKNHLYLLLNEYTSMVREALDTITRDDVRSGRKAHELYYAFLRRKYSHIYNKFAQEAYYKRVLAIYN